MSQQTAENAIRQILNSAELQAILGPHTSYEKAQMVFLAAALAEHITMADSLFCCEGDEEFDDAKERTLANNHFETLCDMLPPFETNVDVSEVEKLARLILASSDTEPVALAAVYAFQQATAKHLGFQELWIAKWHQWDEESKS